MKQLHPGAKWSFRIGGWFLGIFIIGFVSSFIIGGLVPLLMGFGANPVPVILIIIPILLILVFVFGEIYARMAYKRWLYEFTKDGLKLERGIIWKRYSNIPYQRVQNVDVHRGILARMLGFSTVEIQTAGFHMAGRRGMPRSEGHIPAVSVDEAEQIREMVMKKISSKGI